MKESILNRVGYIQNDIDALKADFESVITNKTYSLVERWSLFREAPSYLKNNSSWIEHFYMEPDEQDYSKRRDSDIISNREFNRSQVVDTVGLIDNYRESIVGKEYEDVYFEITSQIDNVGITEDTRLNEIKEDILARNLGSFCFDW